VGLLDRRIGLLFLGFIALLSIALVRALYLGTVQAGALRRAAETQQVQILRLPAQRGTITDSTGVQLAISEAADDVVADPYLIKHPLQDAQLLSPVLSSPVRQLQAELSRPHDGYVVLARLLPAARAEQALKLVPDGLTLLPASKRVYPRGEFAGQVLGWTGWNGQGVSGIEYEFNHQLSGRDGLRRIVNDAIGQPIAVDELRSARAGKSIRLTLNAPLQDEVQRVLNGVGAKYSPKAATAIVVNPDTGAILALANWPQINPNDPAVSPVSAGEDLATAYTYEPGSTFKAVTVSGALQDGLITPSTRFEIPPQLNVDGSVIHDAELHGYETLSTAGILRVSSNIGADLIGQRLGAARFDYWVHRFGFGAPTGVDLPGEDAGIILPLSQYSGTTMYNLPFGQGESVTPMQMITAYAAVANGGILRPPHIVQAVGGRPQPLPRGHRIISATTAAELRQMLIGVYADGGTASGAGIPGWQLAGKTGTANIAVDGRYSDSQYNASFIGMVPAGDPKLLALVVVEDPQGSIYGGSVAAPAFRQIVGWAVPYFGIDPR
jgi:cell division protein FtsI (penicillin-binding protein 3)